MIEAGVFGATGYTGVELIRLLARHEQVRLSLATSRSNADRNLAEVFPGAPEVDLIDPEQAPLEKLDVVFLCLPHGQSAKVAAAALQAGARVIDLSADFRLTDPDVISNGMGFHIPLPSYSTRRSMV